MDVQRSGVYQVMPCSSLTAALASLRDEIDQVIVLLSVDGEFKKIEKEAAPDNVPVLVVVGQRRALCFCYDIGLPMPELCSVMNQYIREEKTGDIEGAPSNPPTGTSQRRSFESTNREVESVDGSHKKKRLFWNEELHGKFVKAVEKLGIGTTPKKILEFMADPRVKRRQVASHLQTYRKQIGYTTASQSLDGSTTECSSNQPI